MGEHHSSLESATALREPIKWTRRRWQIAFVVAIGLFLVWEVLTRSVAAYVADTNPELAVLLRSNEPVALLNLAENRLNLKVTANETESKSVAEVVNADPQMAAQIREWAEQSLLSDPLNARALRLLGQLSEAAPDEARTKTLMRAAVHRSLLETIAVDWMMRKSFIDKDYAAALRYADIFIRTRPQLMGFAMPILGKMAESPNANRELKVLLATNPSWRERFLAALPANISDARTPLDVLLSLKETATPPTDADLRPYLDFLVSHGFHELAYYTWLQFIPPEQLSKVGHLLNGGFEFAPSGLPFDWVFKQGPGVAIQIAMRPDGNNQHALFIQFGPGRVEEFGVKQLIMLAPGNYEFRGQYKSDIVSERGLKWRLTCAGATTPIAESSPINGRSEDWKNFELAFTVPATDCIGQTLSLDFDARSASERFIAGSVWYDNLGITREDTAGSGSVQ